MNTFSTKELIALDDLRTKSSCDKLHSMKLFNQIFIRNALQHVFSTHETVIDITLVATKWTHG